MPETETTPPDLSEITFHPVLLEADHRTGSRWRILIGGEETPYSMGADFWKVRKASANLGAYVGPWRKAEYPLRMTLHQEEQRKAGRPMTPTLESVVASLCLDAECVRHGQTLSEFGSELGYTDLQDGIDAWEGCQRSYRILKRLDLDREEVYAWAMEQ